MSELENRVPASGESGIDLWQHNAPQRDVMGMSQEQTWQDHQQIINRPDARFFQHRQPGRTQAAQFAQLHLRSSLP